MHELSVASAILEEIGELAARRNFARVRTVRLQVGELSCLVDEALRFAWEVAAAGTVAAGSQLDIECIEVEIYCPRCGASRRPIAANYLVCSTCGTQAAKITKGRELLVAGMEVEDADPRA
jgi:hydrogenase nickel incorporation protein HypA/HybF